MTFHFQISRHDARLEEAFAILDFADILAHYSLCESLILDVVFATGMLLMCCWRQ